MPIPSSNNEDRAVARVLEMQATQDVAAHRHTHGPDEILRYAREKHLVYKNHVNNTTLKLASRPMGSSGLARLQFGDGEYMRSIQSLRMFSEPDPNSEPLPQLGEPVQLTRTLARTLSRGVAASGTPGNSHNPDSDSKRLVRQEIDGGTHSSGDDAESDEDGSLYGGTSWIRGLATLTCVGDGTDVDLPPAPATEPAPAMYRFSSSGLNTRISLNGMYGHQLPLNALQHPLKAPSFSRTSASRGHTANSSGTGYVYGSSNNNIDGSSNCASPAAAAAVVAPRAPWAAAEDEQPMQPSDGSAFDTPAEQLCGHLPATQERTDRVDKMLKCLRDGGSRGEGEAGSCRLFAHGGYNPSRGSRQHPTQQQNQQKLNQSIWAKVRRATACNVALHAGPSTAGAAAGASAHTPRNSSPGVLMAGACVAVGVDGGYSTSSACDDLLEVGDAAGGGRADSSSSSDSTRYHMPALTPTGSGGSGASGSVRPGVRMSMDGRGGGGGGFLPASPSRSRTTHAATHQQHNAATATGSGASSTFRRSYSMKCLDISNPGMLQMSTVAAAAEGSSNGTGGGGTALGGWSNRSSSQRLMRAMSLSGANLSTATSGGGPSGAGAGTVAAGRNTTMAATAAADSGSSGSGPLPRQRVSHAGGLRAAEEASFRLPLVSGAGAGGEAARRHGWH